MVLVRAAGGKAAAAGCPAARDGEKLHGVGGLERGKQGEARDVWRRAVGRGCCAG